MEARAEARYIRVSPQKARLVVDLIRGRNAGEALNILRGTNKRIAPAVEKVLRSAIANAFCQFGMLLETPVMVACETMPRMRERNSESKPFITDITVISAVMPMIRPSIDTTLMKEMKWLRRLARM